MKPFVSSLGFSPRALGSALTRCRREQLPFHHITDGVGRFMRTSDVAGWKVMRARHMAATSRSHSESLEPGDDGGLAQSVVPGSQGSRGGGPLPYASIPGPKPLPLVGNKLLFTSLGGYPLERFWNSSWKLYKEYGPIVKVSNLTGGLDMVLVFQPDDTRRIFQAEGPYPARPGLDILTHYRARRPHWFSSPGLVPGNGPEWRRLRSAVHSLLRRQVVSTYRPGQTQVAQDFVRNLRTRSQMDQFGGTGRYCHVEPDLLSLLFHYTLEAVGVPSLGTRLGCLNPSQACGSTAERIIRANQDTLDVLGKAIFAPPFHKIFPTASYRRLATAQDTIFRIVQEEVTLRLKERAQDPEGFSLQHPFLDSLLSNPRLSVGDVFLLLTEIFQGGIDATATTLGFCVYFLARDERCQDLLYHEVKDLCSATHTLQGLPYLRAVVQETMRLRPSASSRSRIIHEDTVFSGYLVPAGTFVTSPPVVACHDQEMFPEPETFHPERWLKRTQQPSSDVESTPLEEEVSSQVQETTEGGTQRKIHPYTIVAFGHGARMCPGRRLAEQEIYIALIELVKNFTMEVAGSHDVTSEVKSSAGITSVVRSAGNGVIGQVMRLNMMPDAPFSIKFTSRT